MKPIRLIQTAVAACLLVSAHPLEAAHVLVYQGATLVPDTSVIPAALDLIPGLNVTSTYTSDAFNTALANNFWDVVIYAEQTTATFADSASQVSTYLANGGHVIGFTGFGAGSMPSLFQAEDWGHNTYLLSNEQDHPIFRTPFALPANTSLSNPGYGEYSHLWGPTGDATGIGWTVWGGNRIILGNDGHSLLNSELTDVYSNPLEGQNLLANEVTYFVNSVSAVPEPTSVLPLGVLIGGGCSSGHAAAWADSGCPPWGPAPMKVAFVGHGLEQRSWPWNLSNDLHFETCGDLGLSQPLLPRPLVRPPAFPTALTPNANSSSSLAVVMARMVAFEPWTSPA